jgi:transcriptional regulator with XRE-family HTH domain
MSSSCGGWPAEKIVRQNAILSAILHGRHQIRLLTKDLKGSIRVYIVAGPLRRPSVGLVAGSRDPRKTPGEFTRVISAPSSVRNGDWTMVATNLRRLMARDGLTFEDVVRASELDERTVRGVVRARNQPHARTLHKLAAGLGVSVDELFRPVSQPPARRFDRATNTLVNSVVAAHPDPFSDWSEADFDELFSRFGTGGQLTETGVLAAAEATNAKRELLRQVGVILETSEAELLAEFVGLLYRRATDRRGQVQLTNAP